MNQQAENSFHYTMNKCYSMKYFTSSNDSGENVTKAIVVNTGKLNCAATSRIPPQQAASFQAPSPFASPAK